MGRFRRFGAGLLASVYGQGVTIAVQLVALPVFIAHWGKELYGAWLMVSAIPAYLALSDIGFSTVAANQMEMAAAAGRRDEAIRIFQGTLGILVCASMFVVLVSVCAALSPFRLWSPTFALPQRDASTVVVLLGAQVAASFVTGLLGAAFRADGRFARATASSNTVRLVESLAQVAAVGLVGAGPVLAAGVTLMMRGAGTLAMALDLNRCVPWIRWSTSWSTMAHMRAQLGAAVSFAIWPLTTALQQQGLVILTGVLLGPPAVVVWTACRTIARALSQFFGVLNAPLWPEFSRAFGEGNTDVAVRIHRLTAGAVFWLAVPLAVLLFLLKDFIFASWSRGAIVVDNLLFCLVLAQTVLSNVWGVSSVVTSAVNRHQRMTLVYLFVTVLAVAISKPAIDHFGLAGGAASVLLTDLVMIPFAWVSALALLGDDFPQFFNGILRFPSNLIHVLRHQYPHVFGAPRPPPPPG